MNRSSFVYTSQSDNSSYNHDLTQIIQRHCCDGRALDHSRERMDIEGKDKTRFPKETYYTTN